MRILEFKTFEKNSLRGFCDVEMPSGMIIHGITIFEKDGTRWASPPSKAAIGKSGTQIHRDGKPLYNPIVSFTTKELRDKWSDAVIKALDHSQTGQEVEQAEAVWQA